LEIFCADIGNIILNVNNEAVGLTSCLVYCYSCITNTLILWHYWTFLCTHFII